MVDFEVENGDRRRAHEQALYIATGSEADTTRSTYVDVCAA